ncbi:MAG TPA: hypothetical protein VFV71_12935 [Burkholderiales bacterium]|nr:hypothetical protein [Burkholderiales bacterium]
MLEGMRRLRAGRCAGVAGFALSCALACGPAAAERVHRYTVAIDPGLTTLDVHACFSGAPPVLLQAESLDAPLALMSFRAEGSRRAIEPSGGISLKSVPQDGCVVYQVDVSHAIRQHDRTGDKVHRVGRDLLTSVGIWLWRPEKLAPDEDIEIAFELPDGISVSAPWPPVVSASGATTYRLGHSPIDWPASVAFGHFREREIRVGAARLRMALLDGAPPADAEQVQAWIRDSALSVAALYGRFPQPQAQIVVAPGARGNEPVPWAYVVRGGAPAAYFFINQRRPMAEFFDDWTAVHELAHLLLPYVNPDDIWLSEGVATYYQNVLRARSGKLDAAQAWLRLVAGFAKGMRSAQGMTLAQATESMYREGTYMRVYWEGAAMLFIADVRLRQMTGGKQSLDTALAALNECCGSDERAWSARELFDKLDEVTGTVVFSDIYDSHVSSRDFPDLAATYRALGISDAGGGIAFTGAAAEARLRDAIMGAGQP